MVTNISELSQVRDMEENVGGNDRLIRIIGGAVSGAASLAILGEMLPGAPMWASPVLGILALILLGTAYTKKCKINEMLDRDTSE